MWFLLLLLYTAHIEPVVAQGDRLILTDGSNACEGFIGVYHKGVLGYVGHTLWSDEIEKVVCKSIHCGVPVNSSIETAPWPINKVWLNELVCDGEEDHLWKCKHPGWGISFHQMGTLIKIQCSNKIKMSLDGFKCAGAVQYSTDGEKTHSGYLCDSNWGDHEANLLCEKLSCGGSRERPQKEWMVWNKFSNDKMTIDCTGMTNVSDLWQCATEKKKCKTPASVICTDFEILQLEGNPSNVCSGRLQKLENDNWIPVITNKTSPDMMCQQMHCGNSVGMSGTKSGTQLNCTDNVKVALMDETQPSTCYGAVHIEVNGTPKPVCATTWSQTDAELVCKELNCGKMIEMSTKLHRGQPIMDNVKCSGKESSLWHCSAKRGDGLSGCSRIAYVVCADSVEGRLADGPGKCAGRVEIQYEGKWQRARKKDWHNSNSNTLCTELGCGKRNPTSEIFSQGSGEFLAKTVKCTQNTKNISQCDITAANKNKEEAIGITCDGHKVVILEGDDACSGMVGIKHNDKTFWLSGSNETWKQETANTVCRQMHCGQALNHAFESNDDRKRVVWVNSYSCLPSSKSLFDCENTKLPLDHNGTIATVKCSGKLNISLTKGCWGNVNVCMDDNNCSSVCADAWTEKQSLTLCKNLKCGDTVLKPITKPDETKPLFTSLHCSGKATNLTQCNFVRNENDNTCKPAYVVCSGSVTSEFHETRDKCSGNVRVHYDGKSLPVCKGVLKDINTQNAICGEQKCGQTVKEIDYFGRDDQTTDGYVISKIQCSNGEKSLRACNITSEKKSCDYVALECSNWRKMGLTMGKACSGAVSVHLPGEIRAVSIEGWTETEGEILCQDLECGKFKSNKTTTSSSHLTTSFSCARGKKPKHIWECETSPTTLLAKQQQSKTKEQLFIECEEKSKVTLSRTCHGEVRINNIEVCASHWDNKYSQLVCQELNCSNAIPGSLSGKQSRLNTEYFHVSCEDNHYELGQCKRYRGTCNGNLVSVHCVGKITFNTTERCGGQIQVNYRDKLEKVCPLASFPPNLKDSLCSDCHGHNKSMPIPKYKDEENLKTSLSCTTDTLDIKYCVHIQSCNKVYPAEIYCNDYDPPIEPPERTSTPTVPIILGIGCVLILVVLIVIFIRICIIKKAKNVSSRKLPREEVEFESGDYDDVTSKANEMEVLNHGTFRSVNEVVTENDARSTSSFPYDDIDEVALAQPLTSEAATADTSGESDIHEGALHQDGVIYEVDDPQENYEDIEAKIIQTEAEVHDSPQTTPECDAPPGLVQGDDDYLVPGQDG